MCQGRCGSVQLYLSIQKTGISEFKGSLVCREHWYTVLHPKILSQ